MGTYYVLCAERDGLPYMTKTDDMRSERFAYSGRLWANKEDAEAAARDLQPYINARLTLRTVEI